MVRQTAQAGRFDEFGNVRGEFLFLDVYKAPFRDEAGEIIGTVGCGRVVTDERRMVEALQEREEEYHRIVEQAASIIVKVDLSGQILFMNHFGLDLFGYTMDELYHKNAVGTIVSDKKAMTFFERCPISAATAKPSKRVLPDWANISTFPGRIVPFMIPKDAVMASFPSETMLPTIR